MDALLVYSFKDQSREELTSAFWAPKRVRKTAFERKTTVAGISAQEKAEEPLRVVDEFVFVSMIPEPWG